MKGFRNWFMVYKYQPQFIFFTIVFRTSLQSYLRIMITKMKQLTLQQHKQTTMLCEERLIIIEARNALLVPHNIK